MKNREREVKANSYYIFSMKDTLFTKLWGNHHETPLSQPETVQMEQQLLKVKLKTTDFYLLRNVFNFKFYNSK